MLRRLYRSLLVGCGLGLAVEVVPVLAQCAMCRTAVAGSSQADEIAKILNTAILVLLIPPLAVLGLVFWLALTIWNRRNDEQENPESAEPSRELRLTGESGYQRT
jgi:heme/copper-type cytochrome/quinol oxidase subunit 2